MSLMPTREKTLVALLFGPDQAGIVARVAGWIYEHGGNIIHADQHRDQEAGVFFQRIEWSYAGDSRSDEAAFSAFARNLGMEVRVADADHRSRVALMVSRFDHCFHDLVLRWKAGEFRAEIVAVLSNHEDLRSAAEGYGLPFHVIPVEKGRKAEAESRQLELLHGLKLDLVVLARYMQVLSADFLERIGCPVINIHHSFLPAFAGGRPYHQAHNRGVKLIGATAHYVTPVLDDGPIIVQDVARVTHRHEVNDLIRNGRDLEKLVLATALRSHLEHRILVYNNKTVVFD
jgi:formyltetrahydrofolate deformylase